MKKDKTDFIHESYNGRYVAELFLSIDVKKTPIPLRTTGQQIYHSSEKGYYLVTTCTWETLH
jgi:hypothetical protein